MKDKKLLIVTMIVCSIGLGLIFSVVIFGSAYPDLYFRTAVPIGLLFVFAGAALCFVSWVHYFRKAIKEKQFILAFVIAALGLLVIIKEFMRII